MEQGSHKTGKLIALIIAIIAIVVLIVAFGSLCTCLCTCGTCGGCRPMCFGGETFFDLPTVSEATAVPRTAKPAATAAPTAAPTDAPEPAGIPSAEPATPVPFGEQTPAKTAAPSISDTQSSAASMVRPKQVHLKNDGTDTVTVLVLMNGSDLESEYQEATEDLTEMVRAQKSDRVNILVETVGTKKWARTYGISSRRSERYRVTKNGLQLVDGTLGQLDTTIPSTLSDFIRWGTENYPADRYILLFWDHGGGPVYGFGYDEFQPYSSTLTIDEIRTALRDGGVYFDLIGMDCCLMSSLEVCCALYDFCDYTLLSEDFEPSCGWSHTGWLSALAKNPAISTPDLAKVAIDDSIRVCEQVIDTDGGSTLALIDEAYMTLLYPAWVEFAYANEATLLKSNYSQLRESTGRAHPRLSRSVSDWFSGGNATLSDYCITDILSLAENIPSAESDALAAALDAAIVYYRATSDESTLSGLSVTLPYGDRAFYNDLKRVFRNAGFDEDYIEWLGKFVSVESGGGFFDFGDWNGWADYLGGYDWGRWSYSLDDLGEWAEDWFDGATFDDVFDWLFGD